MTHLKKFCFTLLGSLSLLLVSLSACAMPRIIQSQGSNQILKLAESAKAGDATNQNALGLLYLTGATPNYVKGLYWLKKSAKQGNPTAQYNLGLIYKNGYGKIKADYNQSKHWFSQSANQGYKLAQNGLSTLGQKANALTEKPKQAINWVENKFDPYRIDSQ